MRVICTRTGPCHQNPLLGVRSCAGATGCAFHTRISEPIEVEDSPGNLQGWAESLIEAGKIGLRYHQAFEAMAAAFEELAGEHRETLRDLADMDLLYDTLWREFNSLQAVPPSPGPDYSLVRQHWARRRRSRTAPEARSEAAPTEDTAEAVSASPARSGELSAAQQMDRLLPESGEETPGNWYNTDLLDDPAVYRGVTVWYCEGCGKPTDRYPCKCGYPAPSNDAQPASIDAQSGAAVCRWEVGRWGICGAT